MPPRGGQPFHISHIPGHVTESSIQLHHDGVIIVSRLSVDVNAGVHEARVIFGRAIESANLEVGMLRGV